MAGRFPSGQVIGGRYRLQSLLGQGGFGEVYVAEQLGLDRPVALKLLHGPCMDPVVQERFEREARLAQRLEHPNTVRLRDFGLDADGSPYIAFELLRGRPLGALLREQGSLPPRRVCRIAEQVLKSLMEAHGLGIVHRDVKPANLFVTEHAGEPDFCKVLDFGIAKSLDSRTKALTSDGEVVGTPAYMAPEAFSGELLTPAADLYSLGIVMTEMLSGARLLTGDALGIVTRHLSSEPLPLPGVVTASPLGPVVARATAKHPAARYPSAAEMLREVEAVHARLGAAPEPMVSSPPPDLARRPAPTLGVTQPGSAAMPRGVAPPPPSRRRDEDWTGLLVAAAAIVCLLVAGAWVVYHYLDIDAYLGGPKSAAPPASAAPRPRR